MEYIGTWLARGGDVLPSDLIRSTIDLVILSTLAEAPSYGYAIGKQIAEISDGDYVIKETTLYAAIRRLEQRGDLSSFSGEETSGRPRTYYTLTGQGRAQLETRTRQWRTTERIIARFLQRRT